MTTRRGPSSVFQTCPTRLQTLLRPFASTGSLAGYVFIIISAILRGAAQNYAWGVLCANHSRYRYCLAVGQCSYLYDRNCLPNTSCLRILSVCRYLCCRRSYLPRESTTVCSGSSRPGAGEWSIVAQIIPSSIQLILAIYAPQSPH